jgi:hypothetical protein
MSGQEISEHQRRDWRMLTYGAPLLAPAAVLLVACPGWRPTFSQSASQSKFHAARDD